MFEWRVYWAKHFIVRATCVATSASVFTAKICYKNNGKELTPGKMESTETSGGVRRNLERNVVEVGLSSKTLKIKMSEAEN